MRLSWNWTTTLDDDITRVSATQLEVSRKWAARNLVTSSRRSIEFMSWALVTEKKQENVKG
jgi:ribosomal protein L16/L10AE